MNVFFGEMHHRPQSRLQFVLIPYKYNIWLDLTLTNWSLIRRLSGPRQEDQLVLESGTRWSQSQGPIGPGAMNQLRSRIKDQLIMESGTSWFSCREPANFPVVDQLIFLSWTGVSFCRGPTGPFVLTQEPTGPRLWDQQVFHSGTKWSLTPGPTSHPHGYHGNHKYKIAITTKVSP